MIYYKNENNFSRVQPERSVPVVVRYRCCRDDVRPEHGVLVHLDAVRELNAALIVVL